MSRLAKRPIELPKGVEFKREKGSVHVKGPLGALTQDIPEEVLLDLKENELSVSIDEKKMKRPFLGLYRGLVNSMVEGVSKGFEKRLTLIGVGYRAAVSGNKIDLQLGFSHPSSLPIPEGVTVKVEKSTSVIITGANKQVVGQFAANIRALRPPEPYKGKGVRYEDERVRKKAGKAAKGK